MSIEYSFEEDLNHLAYEQTNEVSDNAGTFSGLSLRRRGKTGEGAVRVRLLAGGSTTKRLGRRL